MKPTALAAVLCLSACSSVSLPGLAQLYALSPVETDPADLAVALNLPDGLKLREGTAVFAISSGTKDGTKKSNESYVLVPSPGSNGSTVYQINEADWPKIRAQQKLIGGWEREDPRGHSGSFSVGLQGCAINGGPEPDATLSIAMRTSAEGSFVPLLKNAAWSEAMNEVGLESLDPC